MHGMDNTKFANTTDMSDIHSQQLGWGGGVTLSGQMKVEEAGTPETLVNLYQTTNRHILHDSIRGHRRENL
jgi:hypothetical protein